ncbi:MAG: tRNA (adenosine(37)-N6)-threonylcarbamoyltransferase complex dimerization subunit type 1 TsaB [Pseudomonadota bacterium]|nr:tRNA (adenosine(37)-N6)-threonylcarbamoyltransferase complex dimerization subunit type 1 TsaB [Pseudomonadota bacterium]
MPESFKCIAVETATENCSIAVSNNNDLSVVQLSSPKESASEVYVAIQKAIDDVQLSLDDLDCIAYGSGPGSFTGVRVAAGVAQGLAYSLGLPVCRVSTLAALAYKAKTASEYDYVAPCLVARMGECYLGLYHCSIQDPVRVIKNDSLMTPEEIILDEAPPEGWLVAGSGWNAFPDLLDTNSSRIAEYLPDISLDASAVLQLAKCDFALGNTVTVFDAIPNYIRNKVTS